MGILYVCILLPRGSLARLLIVDYRILSDYLIDRSIMLTSSAKDSGDSPSAVPAQKPSTPSTGSRFSHRIKTVPQEWTDEELERQYDLTPVEKAEEKKRASAFTIDPWEKKLNKHREDTDRLVVPSSPVSPSIYIEKESDCSDDDEDNHDDDSYGPEPSDSQSVFIEPNDIHPNMEHNTEDIDQLRLLAGKLSADWRGQQGTMAAPALLRRIRDFQFAQEKRRKKYGDERPWGILGLYDHLASIRIDVEWAEDAAWRRSNGMSYMSWAEYDESKKTGLNRPYFTYLLLFVCTGVLIASIAVNGWKVEPIAENPMIGPSADTLILMGAKDTALIVNENEGWRLLSSAVLHAGLIHYFVNILALWFVGGAVEMSHGRIAATIIFTISAVGGTVFSALFLPTYITVGASGGIFGFIGACLADITMNWKLLFCDFVTEHGEKRSHIMVVAVLVLDMAVNIVLGLTPYVDNFCHLGGMFYGFLCGMSTMQRLNTNFFGLDEEACTKRAKHFFMRFFGIIVSMVTLTATLIVLLQGDGETNPCPNCTWLSCVPFPPWRDATHKWWYCDECGRVTADLVSEPELHLDLHCPESDTIVSVNLTDMGDVTRSTLQKNLPTFCRYYCLGLDPNDNGDRYF